MLIIKKALSLSTVLAATVVFMNLNPTNAWGWGNILNKHADSSESKDEASTTTTSLIGAMYDKIDEFVPDEAKSLIGETYDSLYSMIDDDVLDDVVLFTQSSSPTHDSMHGSCVKANNNVDLGIYINSSPDGQVRLCPGTIDFHNEIVLPDKSITLSCTGPRGSCILDGHEETRHFFSDDEGLTFAFIGLALINGFVDDSSNDPARGGSVRLNNGSTGIFDGILFYNNRAISSTDSVLNFAVSTII